MNMRPFKNRTETIIGVCVLVALGTLPAYIAVILLFLGVCAYLYLQYESHNFSLHLEVAKSVITSTSARLQPTMSSFIRSVQQRAGVMSDESKSEMHISRADSPVTSRLRRVSIASSGSRYERSRSEFSLSRGSISSPTRHRLSPANRSVLDVYNRGDNRSPQKNTYSETLGYSYKSSPWNRSAYSSTSENNRTPSNTNVKTVQNVSGPLLATSRVTPNKSFDLRLYADANSPGLAGRSVYYSQMSGGHTLDENRRPLSPLLPTHQPQYRTVGQFPIVRLNQKGSSANSLPVLTAAVSPKAPRAHGLSSINLMENTPTHVTPVVVSPHPAVTPQPFSSPAADTTDPQDICAKSIIEALKEISRKRIRSQCLTPNEIPDDEAAKRQRRNASLDTSYMDDAEAADNSMDAVSQGGCQTKRGRSDSLNSSSDGSERGGTQRGLSGEGAGSLSAARSRAKRLCSNEILSSLSSSRCLLALASNNKRKFNISPDGTPRSGTPTPLQVGKHFKSGSSPEQQAENGLQDEDMIQETPVKRKELEVLEEQADGTPETPPRTPTPAGEVSVSITNSDDTSPDHWKRPAAAVQNGVRPHQATPHPARKIVRAQDLAEQRRADRSALVDLLTVIGKGESPFRDKQSSIAFSSAPSTLLTTPASTSTPQQQKHVTFSDSTKASELSRADTVPIEESQEAPSVGTPASTPQGSMTGTTNTPPTISRTSQRAQSSGQQTSPSGSVMSSFPAVPGVQSGSSAKPTTQATTSASMSAAGSSTSTSVPSNENAATTTTPASFKPTAQSGTASPQTSGTPPTAAVVPKVNQDAASKPQQQTSTTTTTSLSFLFGAPKVSAAPIVANTSTSGGFSFQPSSAPSTNIFGNSPKSTSQSAANPVSSSVTTTAGGFQFAAAKTTTTSAAPTTGTGGFQFASTGTTTAPASKPSFQFVQSSTTAGGSPKPGGFSFSAGTTEKTDTQVATSGSGAATNPPSIFGSSAPQPSSAASTTTSSLFGSASTTQNQAPGAAAPTPVLTQTQAPAASTATTQQSVFGNTATLPSSQASTFASTTQSAAFATPAFGNSTQSPSKPAFQAPSFGATTTTQSQIFGSNAPSFGGNATQATAFAPGSTNQKSTFGSVSTGQAQTFGSVSTSQPSTFAPGSTPTFGVGSANQTSLFGSGSTNQTPTFGSGSGTQTPAFGSGSAAQAAPAFGSSSQNATPSFGSGAAGQTTAFGSSASAQPSAFGSGSGQAPAFGATGSNQTPAFGASTAAQPSSFPSGSTSQGSAFGSGPVQPSAFGAVTNKPLTFGASSSEGTPAFGSSGQTSLFGSSGSQPFGGAGSAPTTAPSATFGSSTPAFGTASPFSSTSAFGSPFGSSTGTPAQSTAADNKAMQFPATTSASNQSSVFAFGGSSSAAGSSAPSASAAPFQFGGSAQSGSSAAPKPGGFQFGQPAGGSSAPFMFGSSAAAPAASSPAFQFNASSSTPAGGLFAPAAATGNVGMFSIGSGSTAPRVRTARPRKAR